MGLLLLWCPVAAALTLDEAVQRAGEVDPDAVIASLTWKRDRLGSTETAVNLGVSASASVRKTWGDALGTNTPDLVFSVPIVDIGGWFDALQEAAQVRESRWSADATRLDAQYAAAALYYDVLAAEAGIRAARDGKALAEATAQAIAARVAAGLDNELTGRSAQLGLLQAQASLATNEARLEITQARLARALQQPLDTLTPADIPALPAEGGISPWIQAQEEALAAAKLGHAQRIGELLPDATLSTSTNLLSSAGAAPLTAWSVSLGASWSFDGLAGPFLRERQAAVDVDIAEVQLDAIQQDYALALTEARARARAADRVAEAAQARESLADSSLKIGQSRLEVGLASSLEVLRLQDDAATARADRVTAELERALARLEARRIVGLGWGS